MITEIKKHGLLGNKNALGCKHSKEANLAKSNRQKGFRFSEASKLKMRASRLRWSITPEMRENMSRAHSLCEDCHRKTETYGRPKTKL